MNFVIWTDLDWDLDSAMPWESKANVDFDDFTKKNFSKLIFTSDKLFLEKITDFGKNIDMTLFRGSKNRPN